MDRQETVWESITYKHTTIVTQSTLLKTSRRHSPFNFSQMYTFNFFNPNIFHCFSHIYCWLLAFYIFARIFWIKAQTTICENAKFPYYAKCLIFNKIDKPKISTKRSFFARDFTPLSPCHNIVPLRLIINFGIAIEAQWIINQGIFPGVDEFQHICLQLRELLLR